MSLMFLCVIQKPIYGKAYEVGQGNGEKGRTRAVPVLCFESMDPFDYLGAENNANGQEEMKKFTAEWYQILRILAISGAVVTASYCIIVWAVSTNPNERAERKKALIRKGLFVIAICALAWILGTIVELASSVS